jgi:hypothetical protein
VNSLAPDAQFPTPESTVVGFTGSRLWVDAWTIKTVLDDIAGRAARAGVPELTFRHGACYPYPTWNRRLGRKVRPNRSADYLIHLWILRFGADQPLPIVEQERPADWEAPCRPSCNQGFHNGTRVNHRVESAGRMICPAAGNYRNREMVLEKPAPLFVVAFQQDNTNGTRNCITTARELSIPVHTISPKVTP